MSYYEEVVDYDISSAHIEITKPDDKPTLPPTDTGMDERVLEYISNIKQNTR